LYIDPTGHSWKSFWKGVGRFFEKNWTYVATAIMMATSVVTFGLTSPITMGMFAGTVWGVGKAYREIGELSEAKDALLKALYTKDKF
jgi:hypothetical protein